MKMSENSSPRSSNTPPPHMEFFKKLKRVKLLELSPTILGCFFITFGLFLCLFLLDDSAVNTQKHVRLTTWFLDLSNVTSSSSSSSSPFVSLQESGAKKVDFIEEGGKGCDIFDGDWVWDENYPLYESRDCVFLDEGFRCSENGRPDNLYTKWRWQPKDCYLPRFDAKVMLERLQNRRVVFVGDSIGRNQWESLLCMLSSAVTNKSSIYEVNGSPITKHTGSLVFKFEGFNCTVEYYWAPFLVLQSRAPARAPEKVKMTLKLDQMDWSSSKWKGADILVFNSGHWWNYEKTIRGGSYFQEGSKIKMEMTVKAAFRRSLVTLFDWISREVNMTKSHVFFRSFAPVHFRGGDWRSGGTCHLETLPDSVSSPASSDELNVVIDVLSNHTRNSQLRRVGLLNVTGMTSRRKDAHSSLYYLGPDKTAPVHRQDCSHWCLPGVPDAWNELLYAVFLRQELVRLKSASLPSHSAE